MKVSQEYTSTKIPNLYQRFFLGLTIVVLTTPVALADDITWWNINKLLREFVNNGLAADKLQEQLHANYKWERYEINGQKRLQTISTKVSQLFDDSIKAVKSLKSVIEEEYDTWPTYTSSDVNSTVLCCDLLNGDINSKPEGCAILVHSDKAQALRPPKSVLGELRKSARVFNNKISQYFAFNDGSVYVFPPPKMEKKDCKSYDPRLRYYFTHCKSPEPREVVVVVDHDDKGSNLKNEFLENLVGRIFSSLSPIDKMGLCLPDTDDKCRIHRIGAKSVPIWPSNRLPLGYHYHSLLGDIVASSEKNKGYIRAQFKNWLPDILEKPSSSPEAKAATFSNHQAALKAGFQLFKNESQKHAYDLSEVNYHRVLVYVTVRRDLFQWKTDASLNDQLDKIIGESIHIVIHPISGNATELREEVIMDKKNITAKIIPFGTDEKLNSTITNIASFGLTDLNRPVIPIPYWDAFGAGYIMSICLPLTKRTKFFGTSCIDFSIINLLESETNVDDIKDGYVFIVNSLGNTLMHPLLPSPHSLTQDPSYVTIESLEQALEVKPLLKHIIAQRNGTKDVSGMKVQPIGQPRGTDLPSPVKISRCEFRYVWGPINNTDLTIALILPLQDGKVFSSNYTCLNACKTENFEYHLPKPGEHRELCKFFGTAVMERKGLVKFAPSCFIDVLSYIQGETPAQISRLYSIFNDQTPHDELLRKNLRASVQLLEEAERLWQEQLETDCKLTPFMGARYMGTSDGAFISFPGTSLIQQYDHRMRPWFLKAMSTTQSNSISMTTPFCDKWGAGMVYTITKTLHDKEGNPIAVVAGDLSLKYIMADFLIQVPKCKSHTCFLVNRLGYVVLKSDWAITNLTGNLCRNDTRVADHLIRRAPDIAQDMIASKILQRRVCNDYENYLTFYYWSLGFIGHQTLHQGSTYKAYKLPQTNLYMVVRTAERSTRNCNCDQNHRGMEVMCHDTCAFECECPCIAGPYTRPCSNPANDVHRYPLPACKPRGPITVTVKIRSEDEHDKCK